MPSTGPATPLGAPKSWPQSLKTIVRVMLDSRYAMWMLWGPGMTFFCNDAYLPTVGIKRDWVLGARADKVWEEIWPDIGPRIDHVRCHGEATWDEGLLLFLERSGFSRRRTTPSRTARCTTTRAALPACCAS